MKSLPPQWLKLVAPYRKGDWLDCLEILRPVVEKNPDDLGSRLLFATLCLAGDQAERALVQLEKLLPLAVGQGDLFRAIAAQKKLDQLRGEESAHEQRFVAIHKWFGAVPVRRAKRADAAITPALLLALPPDAFHRVVEASAIEDLGLESHDLAGDVNAVRVVLYGRVRWSAVAQDGSALEAASEPLDSIALPPGAPPDAPLGLAPELPSACLRFDLALLEAERTRAAAESPSEGAAGPGGAARRAATIGPEPATWADVSSWGTVDDARVAEGHATRPAGVAPGAPATEATASSDPAGAVPRAARPVPDPLLEPTVAVGAPFERRRETRVSVSFESRIALLGLAGSRVAPFAGRLFDLSPSGVGLGFPRAELLPVREALEGSLLTVEIQLADGEPPLRMPSRVRWVRLAPRGGDPARDEMGVMGLEFVLVNARDHARLQNALIAAARKGRPLDAPGIDPDPGAAAA